MGSFYPNETFNISNEWLQSFENRHHTSSARHFGECGSVDMDALALALPFLHEKLDTFNLTDIYNMVETGLQYRMLPDHSLSSRQLVGRNQGKERLSAVICAKGDGSDKLPLWIIGKFGKPRCFKTLIWTVLTSNTEPTKILDDHC